MSTNLEPYLNCINCLLNKRLTYTLRLGNDIGLCFVEHYRIPLSVARDMIVMLCTVDMRRVNSGVDIRRVQIYNLERLSTILCDQELSFIPDSGQSRATWIEQGIDIGGHMPQWNHQDNAFTGSHRNRFCCLLLSSPHSKSKTIHNVLGSSYEWLFITNQQPSTIGDYFMWTRTVIDFR